ncbi:MAG: hypothetical protein Q9207_005433 [Kuettlingeria erythrocarpa]
MPTHSEVFLEAPINYLVDGVNAELRDTRARIASLEKFQAKIESREYKFGAVNTLVKLTKHITAKKEANSADKSKMKLGDAVAATSGTEMACRIAQAAQSFTLNDMVANHLDQQVLNVLTKKFPKWINIRNNLAHDDVSIFAQLLLTPEYREKTGLYAMWDKVFKELLNQTIEECAAEAEDPDDMTSID